MKPIAYLAAPYSHEDPNVRERRFHEINRVAGTLIEEGRIIYSAISHSHPIAVDYGLPVEWDFWRDYDLAFMRICSELIVLKLPGWRESKGLAAEIKMAKEMEIAITYLDG